MYWASVQPGCRSAFRGNISVWETHPSHSEMLEYDPMRVLRRLLPITLLMLAPGAGLFAQTQPANIPPPLRVHLPFEKAWEGMVEALQNRQQEFIKKAREDGEIQTEYYEYSSGPLTESHIAKIGVRPKLVNGDWIRVSYQYRVDLDLIEEGETLVTVNANVRALRREFLGKQEWVEIPSNGRLEADLLTDFGKLMFGQLFSLAQPKKGFWEQAPGYVKDADIQPRVVGPERPPE